MFLKIAGNTVHGREERQQQGKDSQVHICCKKVDDIMELIIDNIDELKMRLGYVNLSEYDDKCTNHYLNNWIFIEDYADSITEMGIADADTILYSEYYWSARFLQRYNKIYGTDAGYEQQHFKVIEKMEHSMKDVDWALLERLENDEL